MSIIRTYRFAALATLLIWATVALTMGAAALVPVATLAGLGVALSVDNAAVNAGSLQRLPEVWRRVFLWLGLPISVVGALGTLPVLIVSATTATAPWRVVHMATRDAEQYAARMVEAEPLVRAFAWPFLGGMAAAFLLRRLGRMRLPLIAAGVLLVSLTAGESGRVRVLMLAAGAIGLGLHVLMDSGQNEPTGQRLPMLAGTAAMLGFVRLEAVNTSFTLDSIVGGFAITASLPLLVAGLLSGEVWVRSLTVHMVRAGTLGQLRYLEASAHAAIGLLAAEMVAALYGVDAPSWLTGAGGLSIVAGGVALSLHANRRERLILSDLPAVTPESLTLATVTA